jgi:hypothetical protein
VLEVSNGLLKTIKMTPKLGQLKFVLPKSNYNDKISESFQVSPRPNRKLKLSTGLQIVSSPFQSIDGTIQTPRAHALKSLDLNLNI